MGDDIHSHAGKEEKAKQQSGGSMGDLETTRRLVGTACSCCVLGLGLGLGKVDISVGRRQWGVDLWVMELSGGGEANRESSSGGGGGGKKG